MKIKELYEEERPREKALREGIDQLSSRELLALILNTGSTKHSAIELADHMLTMCKGSIGELSSRPVRELMNVSGIKEAKAIRIAACFEVGRRVSLEKIEQPIQIESPKTLIQWLNQAIGFTSQEQFLVIFLNTQHAILSHQVVFVGTLTSSVVHPREIFREAILRGCAKIICVHNHPSGNCKPSEADIRTTKSLCEIGRLIGIHVLDHFIVGRNSYSSFRELQLLD